MPGHTCEPRRLGIPWARDLGVGTTTEPFPDHDQAIAGAGLTVHGGGYLSYPGEGLVKKNASELSEFIL
eukprot:COSAG02_NODE_3762_length_6271_cov_49.947181_1_plen_69_part_00